MDNKSKNVLIIGAGPSGLTLAYELIQINPFLKPVIVERLPVAGGLSRTVYVGKSGIDIGGHRLFTKDKYVESIWKRFLNVQNTPAIDDFLAHRNISYPKIGADPNFADDVLLIRKRFSSIINENKRYLYPLRFSLNTLKNLGFINSIKAVLSYFKSFIFKKDTKNIENFLINRFGSYLYNKFFKEHTKKIWGCNPSDIINHWQKHRIQRSMFSIPSLWEDEFYYPKFGCSQLWNKIAEYIKNNGGTILLNHEFCGFNFSDNNQIISASIRFNNEIFEIPADYFVSSIPLKDLIQKIDAPYDIKQYALSLPSRDYILASIVTNNLNIPNITSYQTVNNITPDNWIYLQNKNTVASRLQIMNNWSPYLVEDFKNNYLISLEYFCNQNDDIWNLSDSEIIKLAVSECENYNLFTRYDVINSTVIKEKNAYPVYAGSYKYIDKIRNYIKDNYKNLYTMGRNGTHQYINMDFAMVCGINIAREISKGYENV